MAPVHTRRLHAPSPPTAAHRLLKTYIDELLADQNESEYKFSSDKGLDLGVDCMVECCRGDGPLDCGGVAIAALMVGDDSAPG